MTRGRLVMTTGHCNVYECCTRSRLPRLPSTASFLDINMKSIKDQTGDVCHIPTSETVIRMHTGRTLNAS